jgi:hypothetical protein
MNMQLTNEMREYLQSEGLVSVTSEEFGFEAWHFPFMDEKDWIVLESQNYNSSGYPDVSVVTQVKHSPTNPKLLWTLACISVHDEGSFYSNAGYAIDFVKNELKKMKEEEKLNRQSEIKMAGTQWEC